MKLWKKDYLFAVSLSRLQLLRHREWPATKYFSYSSPVREFFWYFFPPLGSANNAEVEGHILLFFTLDPHSVTATAFIATSLISCEQSILVLSYIRSIVQGASTRRDQSATARKSRAWCVLLFVAWLCCWKTWGRRCTALCVRVCAHADACLCLCSCVHSVWVRGCVCFAE